MRYRLGALTAQTIVDAGKNTEECVYIASLRGGGQLQEARNIQADIKYS